MRQFRWRARSAARKNCSGEIFAASEQEVADFVRANYGYVIGIEKVKRSSWKDPAFFAGKTIKHKERAKFFQQLYTLLEAGISIAQALDMMSSGPNVKLCDVSRRLSAGLKKGLPLSGAMQKQTRAFPPQSVAVVEAGELGGELNAVLKALAAYYRRQDKLCKYVRGILAYPAFLIVVSCVTIVFFSVELLPMFTTLYASLGVPETRLLRNLLFLKRLIGQHFLALAAVLIVSGKVLYQKRKELVSLVFRLPGIHGLRRSYLEVRFVKMLALLLRSGIALPEAIRLAVRTVEDGEMRLQADRFADGILHGLGIAASATQAGNLFSQVTLEFLRIGENSGNLSQMLSEAAEIREQELMQRIRELKTILEPLLVMIIATVVFAAIAVMVSPLFSVMTQMPAYQ